MASRGSLLLVCLVLALHLVQPSIAQDPTLQDSAEIPETSDSGSSFADSFVEDSLPMEAEPHPAEDHAEPELPDYPVMPHEDEVELPQEHVPEPVENEAREAPDELPREQTHDQAPVPAVQEQEPIPAKPTRNMQVRVELKGSGGVSVMRHKAASPGARRLHAAARELLKVRTDQYPDNKAGRTDYTHSDPVLNDDHTNRGAENDFVWQRRGVSEIHDAVEVTLRIPHDGDPTTNTQILTLHGRATDADSWETTASSPNDPYTSVFHDPYSGTSGDDTRDGPRAGHQNQRPGTESFFAAWNQESTASNPRGSHDALKISWSCQGIASTQIAPAVAPYESGGHPQGYRKSTGQRTSGHEPFYADERASCSTLPDVTGFNPHCLVHAYDQPPAPRWGAHSLQDGPAITIQVQGPTQTWPANDGADSLQHLCIMRAVDPYGKWSNMTVTINVEKELNQAPEASWRAGGNTTYTVPHDHSPESHHVQVLLDGEYSDDDNLDQNFGPLGNTAQETTDMGIQNQLRWQVTDPDETTDGYDGIFVGDAPARRYVGSGYCKEGTYSATKDFTAASLAACQDACHDWLECHTLFWNSTNSLCWMFNDCVNNDDDQITDLGTGERYTKEQSYGTSWAMFRGRSDAYHPNDHMHGHGNDTVRFLWTCPTASGEFFEETLGHCFEGADTAAASVAENANKSAFCRSWENTTIAGDLHDFCQDACIATEGCRGFEIYDVEYRGACPVESCDASRCELMMLTEDPYEEATNDCPGGFSTHNAVSYSGELNSNNNLHGNGAREARCFTRKQGQQFDILKPVVSLPGPEWTSTSTWSEPGGQVGETSDGGDQWSAEYLDHTCTLRVTDSYEATHTFEQTIRVNREPNTVPQAMAGPDQEYTVPHDFNPETNQVLVTLYGYNSTDADMDKMKHVWNCTMGEAQTAWATVELPFPVILGGIDQGFQTSDKGGIQTGSGDPNYVYSASHVQTAMGWGQDRGHSGDGDDFMGTHSHQANQVTVMLVNGTHTCTVTSTDTYNQASQDSVTIVVNPEPDSAPESD